MNAKPVPMVESGKYPENNENTPFFATSGAEGATKNVTICNMARTALPP
jgi:hypothetical protein